MAPAVISRDVEVQLYI